MKFKGFYYDSVFMLITAVASFGLIAVTALVLDKKGLALLEAGLFFLIFVYAFVRAMNVRKRYKKMLRSTAEKLDYSNKKNLSSLPYPIAVSNDHGFITWANELFIDNILNTPISQDTNIRSLIKNFEEAGFGNSIKAKDKFYTVYSFPFYSDSVKYYAFSFFDNTELKQIEETYYDTRPYVIIAETNNIDDNNDIQRDSEKTEIKSVVEGFLDDWCERFNSVVKKISDDRFMIVTEKTNIQQMIDDKFSVLDTVRQYSYKGRQIRVTLSMGAAAGKTIYNAENEARKALELALDRGGDQVALKKEDEYIFFGGVSKSTDRKFRIKIRFWSNKLLKEFKESSNVIICGHQFSDFDSLGASVGMAYACNSIGLKANIAFNPEKTLAGPLYDELMNSEFSDYFINFREATELMGDNTLFILCDTHSPKMCEFPELFAGVRRKVIIDHHRVAPGTDTDDGLFIHNPGVSSACEIVTELIQYVISDNRVHPLIAQALLSGIVLDTKNYILRSGSMTFEAAAYLCNSGADTVRVNKYFSNSLEVNKQIKSVVLNAHEYGRFVISEVSEDSGNNKLIAAKAADELLNSKSINASFVLYKDGDAACVSARSFGETNVQLIMEKLGGGGHQTMAACQRKDIDMDTLKSMLISELDNISQGG
jgi:c-di-AMP phosphodiesterase-like protein